MNNTINAWIVGAKYYIPCFLIGCSLLYLGYIAYKPLFIIGVILIIISGFILSFFRDFPRSIVSADNEFISPADGTVVEIKEIENTEYYDGKCLRVAIFMSIFNAHVNRAPFDGVIKKIRYKEGRFMNAMKSQASDLNESNAIFLETSEGYITIRQIAGKIARRIVCPVKEGMFLKKGQKIGMIKFGSRVELYLPQNVKIYVKISDKVYAGATIIGKFNKL